jgi:aryl-alcohol dehydrogenase-like predicted oxidoreductase
MRAVEDSLRRLQVDTIDLYQSHWPDKDTPLEETFRAFEDMVRQGKVRWLGCSNHTAAQLQETLDLCQANDIPRYESLQPHYNLVHRDEYEAELMGLCQQASLGVIPYSPLEGGFLTGKYRAGKAPRQSRAHGSDRMRAYMNERGFAIVDALAEIGQARQATIAQTALAWLLANPTVTSAIIGANTVDQLAETIKAIEVNLSAEEKARLDELPSPT